MMGRRTCNICSLMALAAVLTTPPVWAQEQAPPPEVSLTPPNVERDDGEVEAPASATGQEADSEAETETETEAEITTDEESEQEEPSLAISADPAAFAACTTALAALGATFEPVPPIGDPDDAACGIAQPIRLDSAAPGVALNPDTFLRCETALSLAQWVKRTVLPAAEVLSERGEITSLQHGSSYICRRRNNSPTGKPSEHSFGSALDIMGVGFADGSVLAIEPREREGTLEEAFQDAIRAGACLSFTTVLGPGSDEAHANHLHFDIKTRNGGFRLCQ